MKCTQYLYGRSTSQGYAMNKYTDEWPRLPRLANQTTRAKGSGRFPRVMEILREEGMTTLCNAENVVPANNSDRPFAYTQYVFPQDQDLPAQGREKAMLRRCLEMLVYEPLMLDRARYQVEAQDGSDHLSASMLTQIDDLDLQRAYRAVAEQAARKRLADAAHAPKGVEGAAQAAHFSAPWMGVFLAYVWRKAYRHAVLGDQERTVPAALLVTAPWRYEQGLADEKALLHEGVVFLHDEVLPYIPEGLAAILNISFLESGFATRSCDVSAIAVCEPENALYQDQKAEIFCPFEDAGYGISPKREDVVLGKAILSGMPETYHALDGTKASSNYDIARYIADLSEACGRDLTLKQAVAYGDTLLWLDAEIAKDTGFTAEKVVCVLAPLEMQYIQACKALRVDADEKVFGTWVSLLQRAGQHASLHDAYVQMIAECVISGQQHALELLDAQHDAVYGDLEVAILDHVTQVEPGLWRPILQQVKNLLQTDSTNSKGKAYAELLERSIAQTIQGPFQDCLRLTPRRLNLLINGAYSASNLLDVLMQDASILNIPNEPTAQDTDRMMQWFIGAREDAPLAEAAEPVLVPLAMRFLPDADPLLKTYLNSGWAHEQIEESIVQALETQTVHDFLHQDVYGTALRRTRLFMSDPKRRACYSTRLGDALIREVQAVPECPGFWANQVLSWPADDRQVGTALCEVLARCDGARLTPDNLKRFQELPADLLDLAAEMLVSRCVAGLDPTACTPGPLAQKLHRISADMGLTLRDGCMQKAVFQWLCGWMGQQDAFSEVLVAETVALCQKIAANGEGVQPFHAESAGWMTRAMENALATRMVDTPFLESAADQCRKLGVLTNQGDIQAKVLAWSQENVPNLHKRETKHLAAALRQHYAVELQGLEPPMPDITESVRPEVPAETAATSVPAVPDARKQQPVPIPAHGKKPYRSSVDLAAHSPLEVKLDSLTPADARDETWRVLRDSHLERLGLTRENLSVFDARGNLWGAYNLMLTHFPEDTTLGKSLRRFLDCDEQLVQDCQELKQRMPHLDKMDQALLCAKNQNPLLKWMLQKQQPQGKRKEAQR